jgi:hypothetical protein
MASQAATRPGSAQANGPLVESLQMITIRQRTVKARGLAMSPSPYRSSATPNYTITQIGMPVDYRHAD